LLMPLAKISVYQNFESDNSSNQQSLHSILLR
jgi:hypothetical protein